MTLTLRAVSLNDLPLTQPITAEFGPQGGTIGRADGNTLALPDPERHISRQQAEIRASGTGYVIFNIGSANPITVGGQSLAQGQSLPVRDRDEIRVGGYLLEVTISAADDTNMMLGGRVGEASNPFPSPLPGATPGVSQGAIPGALPTSAPAFAATAPAAARGAALHASPHAAQPAAPVPASDPFADLLGGSGGGSGSSPGNSSGANPFADLLGAPPPPAPRSAFGQTHKTTPVAAPAPAVALLPDDFDPFAPPPAPTRAPTAAPSSAGGFDFGGLGAPMAPPPPMPRPSSDFGGGGAFGDLIPSSGNNASSLDDLFGLQASGTQSADPLAGFMAGATRGLGDASHSDLPTDPMALFGDKPAKPAHSEPVTPALPDHTSALSSSFRPPEVRAGQTPARQAVPAQDALALQAQGTAVMPVSPTASGTPTASSTFATPSTAAAGASAGAAVGAIPASTAGRGPALPPDVLPPSLFPTTEAGDTATPLFMDSEAGGLISPPPAPPRPAARPSSTAQAPLQPPPAQTHPGHAQASASSSVAAAPAAGVAGPAAAAADTAALWQAFSEGAGIRFDPAQGVTPDLMRVIGQLLRSSIDGTLQMMAVRAATKHELRAQVTVIRSRDNNPLKFSPDAQSALEQLLQPPVRGFLPGPAAMSDAMHDLVGHTIGTMAGTRAALEGVLGRFKPEMLESKLTSRSMLDSVLTLNRKAKLWELYLQHFESIREEAQEDFHNLFGKAFLEAYEEQLERLNQRKTAA
ncbi:type VI secretion system-associated FHA domain protein TagH [Roseateles terrae]|uniref:FHA domain-containing protein n=1 Tax=Roseateles terrae TaxID=431060 RepID=A0ABR6GMB2_9BURK|nr:type VI secretion system-associated FHA domain protein TagH [Roseateles terrae]MBB3193260.1 FHA domain-containing protein [Roseateles terrae]